MATAPEKPNPDKDSTTRTLPRYFNTRGLMRLSWLRALRPQLLLDSGNKDASRGRGPSPTAWMDGFRGFAAFAVFNNHWLFSYSMASVRGFNANNNPADRRFIALPGIREAFDGYASLCVFFGIGGYVTSVKFLKLATANETDKALRGLVPSVFRRFLRFYTPVVFLMLMIAILVQLGAFEALRPMLRTPERYFPGPIVEKIPPREVNMIRQLGFLIRELSTLCNVWRQEPFYAAHDPHLWTIPVEFVCGLYLYIVLVMLASCRAGVRLAILVMFAVLSTYYNKWETTLYLGGAAVAQYDIFCKAANTLPRSESEAKASSGVASTSFPVARRILRVLGYCAAIFFIAFPHSNVTRPVWGYGWVNNFIPRWYKRKDRLPKSIGVLSLMALMTTSPQSNSRNILHRFFMTRFCQYFGTIMFGFYLVHGTVLHTYGYVLPHWIWAVTGKDNAIIHDAVLVFSWAVCLVISVCLADLWTREIDPRCARIAARVEKLCFKAS